MAENKKSFILYSDLLTMVDKLPDETAGKLFKIILDYVNDNDPKVDDLLLQVAFEPIKQQMKRDLKEWEVIKRDRSDSGKLGNLKRWNIDLYDKVMGLELTIPEAEVIAKHRKATNGVANIAVNVNDNVTVNVNDNVKERVQEGTPADLKNSNLFRSPKIPTKEEVHRVFLNQGGNEEMANKFFLKYNSTGWYLHGSPIINFSSLAFTFIENWNKNLKNGSNKITRQQGQQAARALAIDIGKREFAAIGEANTGS